LQISSNINPLLKSAAGKLVLERRGKMTTERLYTPWRLKYVASKDKNQEGCVFCNAVTGDVERDRKNFVVYRGEETFVIMNVYPYNVGHLMILPRQHFSTLSGLSSTAQLELMALTTYFTEILTEIMAPDGFNIGLNLGKAAGAGIDAHLHMHIVPRWVGDSNFMPVVGQTRVLPEELCDTYDKIVARIKQQPPRL
jgi:ATP adenylyltransferase